MGGILLLEYGQVFSRGEGGSEAPIRHMARWGLHRKFTQPLSSVYQTFKSW